MIQWTWVDVVLGPRPAEQSAGFFIPTELQGGKQMSYVSIIADSILSHSENTSVLGPEVYTAIAEWEKREIPLNIVQRSIDEVCGRRAGHSSDSIPVEMFQEAIIRNFRSWLAKDGECRAAAA